VTRDRRLSNCTLDGCSFKEIIMETLRTEADLHAELIEKHFARHLEELPRG